MEMREFFEENNAESLAQIIERMIEAERKDYWETDEETVKKLVETYAELAVQFDVATNNEKFNEYMDEKLTGFGQKPLTEQLAEMATLKELQQQAAVEAANAAQQAEQVSGQKLEKQQVQEIEPDIELYVSLSTIFFIFLLGGVYQNVSTRKALKAVA